MYLLLFLTSYINMLLYNEKFIWCGTEYGNQIYMYKAYYESGEMTPSPESIVGWLLENQDTIVELKPLMAGKQISK